MKSQSTKKPSARKPGSPTEVRRPPTAKTVHRQPAAHSKDNRPTTIYVVVSVVGLFLLVLLISFFLSGGISLFPRPTLTAITSTATVTLTPTPTLSPDLARSQLEHTIAYYTQAETIEVKCALLGCKQVHFYLTLFTEQLLVDTVRAELTATGNFTLDAYQRRIDELKTRLNMDEQLVFLLTLHPGRSGWFPGDGEIMLGPIQQNLALLTTAGQAYPPLNYDAVWDQDLSPDTMYRGYIFFPRRNEAGQLFEDIHSLMVRLQLNTSLDAKRSNVLWTFDLLTSPPVVTLTPTPTIGPPPTPGPPTPTPVILVDRDVIMAVLELLTELARRPAGP